MKITEHRTKEILNLLDEFADHAPMFEGISKKMFHDTAALIRQLQAEVQEAWHAGLDAGREQGSKDHAHQPPSAPVGVVEALSELVDLMQGVIDGEYTPDSFTLQPARAALAQQPAAVDGAWRQKASEWLEAKAVEQEANNQRWPDHAAVYKEWRDRPGVLRYLAAKVLATQPGGSDNDR